MLFTHKAVFLKLHINKMFSRLLWIYLLCSVIALQSSCELLKKEITKQVLRYDYMRVLDLSLLFYEAQRSGKLPPDNRIPWRQDSCLQCRGPEGQDLSGGYYTNGRHVKFTFPNAAALTILAWGVITRNKAYQEAGLLQRTEEALKWGADYLVKCDFGNRMVALVGNINDLDFYSDAWVRPEDYNSSLVPVYTISKDRPGSDLCGEMAAALAATYIALKRSYPKESIVYLEHAINLFQFAIDYKGIYSESVKEADNYRSWYGYEDEIIWSALWLYFATKDRFYIQYSEQNYEEVFEFSEKKNKNEFSWADKTNGAILMLYAATKKEKYLTQVRKFCDDATDPYKLTKKGLYERNKIYGNLRYSSNAAFLCFELGERMRKNLGVKNPYIKFTMQQIHYALGDTGRSFVVGFGYDWPQFAMHVGSSCREPPCGLSDKRSTSPNPHTLIGALVGGPDRNDLYDDTRNNEQQNAVALDNNAGFQSAVVSLLHLHYQNRLPKSAYANCQIKFQTKNTHFEL